MAQFCQLFSIHSLMAPFWRGATSDDKRIHWVKWAKMCSPKDPGGMEFQNMSAFNQALLAKQGWRLLKGKYYLNSSFLEATRGSNLSYLWTSVSWRRELLTKGLLWQVRNGPSIRVFQDPWLLRLMTFKSITTHSSSHANLQVSQLLTYTCRKAGLGGH